MHIQIDLNHPDADLGQSKLKDTLQELLAVLSDVPCAAVPDVPPITRLSRLSLPSATPMVIVSCGGGGRNNRSTIMHVPFPSI